MLPINQRLAGGGGGGGGDGSGAAAAESHRGMFVSYDMTSYVCTVFDMQYSCFLLYDGISCS